MSSQAIVMAVNDLETRTIQQMVEGGTLNVELQTIESPWGASPTLTASQIKALANKHVILIDLHATALEAMLTKQGCTLEHMDRKSSLSVLEQLARRFNLTLTADQTLIAANDRGHIPLLARTGALSEDGIWALRHQDLSQISQQPGNPNWSCEEVAAQIQKTADAIAHTFENQQARFFTTGRKDAPLPLYLISLPERHRYTALDGLFKWRQLQELSMSQPLEALFLFYDEERYAQADLVTNPEPENKDKEAAAAKQRAAIEASSLTRLEYYGPGERVALMQEWLADDCRATWGTGRLTYFHGGSQMLYFGAIDDLGAEALALNNLADHLLDNLLIGSRPALAWHTHFIQPFQCKDSLKWTHIAQQCRRQALGDERISHAAACDQEKNYFLSQIQRIITPDKLTDKTPFKTEEIQSLWTFDLLKQLPDLSLKNSTLDLEFKITGLRLHLFYNQTLALEWQINHSHQPAETSTEANATWQWQKYLNAPTNLHSLAQILDTNAKLRICFSYYLNDTLEKADTEDKKKEIIQNLETISLLQNGKELASTRIGIGIQNHTTPGYFSTLITLSLKALELKDVRIEDLTLLSDERARIISACLNYGDQPNLKTSRDQMTVIEARHTTVDGYEPDHFYNPPFALEELEQGYYRRFSQNGQMFNATSHSFVFMGYQHDWFTGAHVYSIHMKTMYPRMWLLVLFYRVVLDTFQQSIRYEDNDPLKMRDHLKSLNQFTNNLWYSRFSSNIQGQELQDIMMTQMRLKDEYQQIRDEVERTESFITNQHNQNSANFQTALSYIGLPLVIFFGLIASKDMVDVLPLWSSIEWISNILGFSPYWFTGGVTLAISLLVKWIIGIFSSKQPTKDQVMTTIFSIVGILVLLFLFFGAARDKNCAAHLANFELIKHTTIEQLTAPQWSNLEKFIKDGADNCDGITPKP